MTDSYTSWAAINRACESATRSFYAGMGPGAELADVAGRLLAGVGRAERALRLVKATKSPTDPYPGLTGAYFNRPAPRRQPAAVELEQPAPGWAPNADRAGTFAVVERRDWSGEWRVRFETNPGQGVETPDQAGDRITAMLSERGARKISESCYYVATKRGGYSTFLTLTLDAEKRHRLTRRHLVPVGELRDGWQSTPIEPARAKQGPFAPDYRGENQIATANQAATVAGPYAALHPETGRPYTPLKAAWSWSIQREASRFFEAIGKMYQRGWQYTDDDGKTHRLKGSKAWYCVEGEDIDKRNGAQFTRIKWRREPLDYLWVAENPDVIDEETGEVMGENPHLHVLMRWRVPYKHFPAWSERIERLWGNGFAHLEKLKDPEKAGGYVAKAAGYMSKGQGKSDQGEIRGNRYGISTRARAPGWMECERHQVGLMGWLMAEAHEAWNRKHGPKVQQREKLKAQLERAKVPAQRQKIGQLLEQVRREIEPLPRVSKYAAIFKGDDQKERFFEWAKGRGWTPERQTGTWLHEWRREQWRRRNNGRLIATATDVADWFALADAGAVMCDERELIAA